MKVPFPLNTEALPPPKHLCLNRVRGNSDGPSPFTAFANAELSPLEHCEAVADGLTPIGLNEASGGVQHAIDTTTPIADPRRKVRVKASQLTVIAAAAAAAKQQESIVSETPRTRLKEMQWKIEEAPLIVATAQSTSPAISQSLVPTPVASPVASPVVSPVAIIPSPCESALSSFPTASPSSPAPSTQDATEDAFQEESAQRADLSALRIHELWSQRNNLRAKNSPKLGPTDPAPHHEEVTSTDDDSASTLSGDTSGGDSDGPDGSLIMDLPAEAVESVGDYSEGGSGSANSSSSSSSGSDEEAMECDIDQAIDDFDAISPTTMENLTRALELGEGLGGLEPQEEMMEGAIEEVREQALDTFAFEDAAAIIIADGRAPRLSRRTSRSTRNCAAGTGAGTSSGSASRSSSSSSNSSTSATSKPTKARLRCTCSKTRCLKLYCECFSTGVECEAGYCRCTDCYNDSDPLHEEERALAVKKLVKKKGRVAFRNTSLEKKQAIALAEGCNCKKSRCVKKYCECYSAGLVCRDNCKCEDCGNNGLVPPPPIKRKRKSRAKKHLQQKKQRAIDAAAAAAAAAAVGNKNKRSLAGGDTSKSRTRTKRPR